jgi:hypothetical protein
MFTAENGSTEDQDIREHLKPLDQENTLGDYRLLFKAMSDFKQKLRSIDVTYGSAYLNLCSLEQKIAQYKHRDRVNFR